MILPYSILKIIDNSGARKVLCIRILGGSKHKTGTVGDTIVVSIKKVVFSTNISKKNKIKKGDVSKAIIIGCKKKMPRLDGSYLSYNNNCAILINEQNVPICTRIFGPVPYEMRKEKYSKILALSPYVI